MNPRNVDLFLNGCYAGNVFNVVRVEESRECYFFYSSEGRILCGINKAKLTHDFPATLGRPVSMADFFPAAVNVA